MNKEDKLRELILSTFGKIEFDAVKYIPFICSMDNWNKLGVVDIYAITGEHFGKSPAMVERSIRYFIEVITKEFGLEELSKILNYHSKTKYSNLEFLWLLDRLYEKEVR